MSQSDPTDRIRVDKWLWRARFFKSRSLAAEIAAAGRLRINSERCAKPAQAVRPGDVLTFPQAGLIRVVRIEAIGLRRGPATEAQALYTDLEPADPAPPSEPGPPSETDRPRGSGRPTKRDRRELERLRPFDP
ncbi:MAG: RNA-binding S4 domain-containing protein [Pseudomonadota bacterium]